ncbi:MAG: hypothetical protein ABSF25_08285 [Bryobacteraceae bacterium]|jgi:hypothetical protein
MKALLCIPLLLAAHAWAADADADRAAIERVVGALNSAQSRPGARPDSSLFTADADNQLDRLENLNRRLSQASKEPWSETTTPKMVIQSIRFITPEVALVDAANTQYGAVIPARRIPVLLVMKKEGAEWRIASLRVMVDLAAFMSLP